MSRVCSICRDSQLRPLVDAALTLKNESLAELSRRTDFSEDTLRRHRRHLKAPNDAATLDEQLSVWLSRLNGLFHAAGANGELRTQIETAKTVLGVLDARQRLAEQAKLQSEAEKTSGLSIERLDEMVHGIEAARPDLDFNQKCEACNQYGKPRNLEYIVR